MAVTYLTLVPKEKASSAESVELVESVTAIIQWMNDRPKWAKPLLSVRQMLIEQSEQNGDVV